MTDSLLSRGEGMALWRQIAQTLEIDIKAGRHLPGAQLPTEFSMAERFSVNRHTVRRAVAALAERGLVRIEQGRGTFVQEQVVDYWVKSRTRFSENIANAKQPPIGYWQDMRAEAAEGPICKALGLKKGAPVWVLERLGEANGRPISLALHYFSKSRFPSLPEIVTRTGTITLALKEFGVSDYTRKITTVTARIPRTNDSRLLQQAANKPVLVTEGINVDKEGRPLEYCVAHWASDRVQIIFEPGL